MVVKSKIKSKAAPKVKSKVNAKAVVKAKVTKKLVSNASIKAKPTRNLMTKTKLAEKKVTNVEKAVVIAEAPVKLAAKPVKATPIIKRIVNPLVERRRPVKRSTRVSQFAFMKAPGIEHAFEVGDTVEVFCDHEKNRERIRGWIKGIVVQVDNKMVAVQFRSNVYLTDGWMVPDRILWYPVTSEHIRAVPGKKAIVKKDFIPEY